MKIGILSMQRINNYGSFLQAFALKRILEERGHDVYFVDIEKKKNYNVVQKNKLQVLMGKFKNVDRYLLRRMKDSKKNKLLNVVFQENQRKCLGLKNQHMRSDGFDAVVIGSDEIFNCSPNSVWGVNGQRFGDIANTKTVISYAASCGYTGVDDLTREDRCIVENALKSMTCISVRDQNSEGFVQQLTGIIPTVNLDPVLIYDFNNQIAQGEKEGIPKSPYMIVYAYHNRIESSQEINAIRAFAKKQKLKIIAIGGSLPWCDEFVVISPFQVLAYFRHAECIVTDTFHGTIFSVKFNRPFAVIVRNNNANKLDDLLQRLKIENHKVSDISRLALVLSIKENYSDYKKIVNKEIKRTYAYLEGAGL